MVSARVLCGGRAFRLLGAHALNGDLSTWTGGRFELSKRGEYAVKNGTKTTLEIRPGITLQCAWCAAGKFHPTHSIPHVAWIDAKIRVEWWD